MVDTISLSDIQPVLVLPSAEDTYSYSLPTNYLCLPQTPFQGTCSRVPQTSKVQHPSWFGRATRGGCGCFKITLRCLQACNNLLLTPTSQKSGDVCSKTRGDGGAGDRASLPYPRERQGVQHGLEEGERGEE